MAEAAANGNGQSTPAISEEFDFETRSVVLSFLGLVPSNVLDQSFSSRGTSSGDSHVSGHRSHSRGDTSLSSLPKDTLHGKVSRLGSTDDEGDEYYYGCNGAEGGMVEDTVDIGTPQGDIRQTLNDLLIQQQQHEDLDNVQPLRPKLSDTGERHKLQKHTSFDIKPESNLNKRYSEDSARRRVSRGHAMYMSPQRPNHIPVRSYLSVDGSGEIGDKHNLDKVSPGKQLFRRDSDFSESSEVTVSVVSSRSTYVDMQNVDLEPLVKNNMINPNIVPLKEELKQEKKELEESFQKGKAVHRESPSLHRRAPGTPASDVSPEAEVAQYLCMLGDQVEARYSSMLNTAFQSVVNRPVDELTYSDLQAATQDMAGHTSGWTKIALMMVFGKRLTYSFVSTGGSGVHKLIDFTSRLVEDSAASFILAKGGWNAITELELSTPCTPSDVIMKFPYDAPEPSTVTGTPADPTTTSSTLDDPSDHEGTDELPVDPEVARDQPDAGIGATGGSETGSPRYKVLGTQDSDESGSGVFSRKVEQEVEQNVSRIHSDILYLRQRSTDFSRHMEEEKRRFEEEQALWRRFGYMALGTIGAIAVGLFLWKRNANKS